MTTTINIFTVLVIADYDDKYLYSRSNMRSRHDYDDQYAREVVVGCICEVNYVVCLLCIAI